MTDVLAATDPLGIGMHYYRTDGYGISESIHSLLKTPPLPSTALDKAGVLEHLRGQPSGQRTCFRAVRPIPAGCELLDGYHVRRSPRPPETRQSAETALQNAVAKILDDPRPKALALSGGLDSALVLALIRRIGGTDVPVYTLASGMSDYCEVEQTRDTARAMGVHDLRIVHVAESDFIDVLPDAITAAEVPFYNLHPVSKLLLARALAADGIHVAVTGDGADQVFGTSDGRDYLPIVGKLFRAAAVELWTPFADVNVIVAADSAGRKPNKSALRDIGRKWVPGACFDRPKQPTYAPTMDLSRFVLPDLTARIAEELGLPLPATTTGRDGVLWTTLGLLVQSFRGDV